jgi:hypothetical protein
MITWESIEPETSGYFALFNPMNGNLREGRYSKDDADKFLANMRANDLRFFGDAGSSADLYIVVQVPE